MTVISALLERTIFQPASQFPTLSPALLTSSSSTRKKAFTNMFWKSSALPVILKLYAWSYSVLNISKISVLIILSLLFFYLVLAWDKKNTFFSLFSIRHIFISYLFSQPLLSDGMVKDYWIFQLNLFPVT